MSVTLREIAERAEVSEVTVSNILNGRYVPVRRRAAQRARLIQRLARQMGYRPNSAARAMARGRFGCAALILAAEDVASRSQLPRQMLNGIHDALAQHVMHLTVARLPDAHLTDPEQMPKILREWSCDGLLIDYNKQTPRALAHIIQQHRVPSIWLNAKRDADCVHPDDLAAGRWATEHVLSLGHRRVAYLSLSFRTDEEAHYSEQDRREGYRQAMQAAGLAPAVFDRYAFAGDDHRQRLSNLAQWLRGEQRPTAVVTYGPSSATTLLVAVERAGLRVPDDLSVISPGGEPVRAGHYVTTLLLPEAAVGRRAVESLVARIAAPAESVPAVAVPPERIDPGDTCGPPPGTVPPRTNLRIQGGEA